MFHVPGCEMKVTEEWENTQSRPMWSVLFVVPASIRARFIICSLQYFWTSVVRSESYDSCSGMNRGSETTHWCNLSFIGIKRTPWCCLLSGTMLGIWYYHCTSQRKLQGAGKGGYISVYCTSFWYHCEWKSIIFAFQESFVGPLSETYFT